MDLTARIVTLRLAETFVIARESADEAEVVQVEVRHGDVSGFGEAAPIERYGESADSALAWLDELALGSDPWALDQIHGWLPPGEYAARAAVDAALHDLQGKLAGLPVYRLLGLRRAGPPTSWTVWLGDPDDMARRAEAAAARGFQRLKLKVGGRDGLDVERVKAVRAVTDAAAAGRRQRVLDARRGARVPAAARPRVLRAAAARGRPGRPRAEAPLAGTDLRRRGLPHARRCRGLRRARARDQHQAREIRRDPRGGAHGARRPRARPRRDARVHGRVGARHRPGAQIASLCDHVDLDGNLLLAEDPWPGLAFVDGVQLPAEAPGLGVAPA